MLLRLILHVFGSRGGSSLDFAFDGARLAACHMWIVTDLLVANLMSRVFVVGVSVGIFESDNTTSFIAAIVDVRPSASLRRSGDGLSACSLTLLVSRVVVAVVALVGHKTLREGERLPDVPNPNDCHDSFYIWDGEIGEKEPEYPTLKPLDGATSMPDGIERMDPRCDFGQLQEVAVDLS